jgi:hypothetical protein
VFVHYSSIFWRKQGQSVLVRTDLDPGAPERVPTLRVAAGSTGPARRGRPWSVGPRARGTLSRQQTVWPSSLVPRAARAQAGTRRPRRPTSSVAAVLWPRLCPYRDPLSRGAQGNAPSPPCSPLKVGRPPPTRTAEDHVWFEDRCMVASLCDE